MLEFKSWHEKIDDLEAYLNKILPQGVTSNSVKEVPEVTRALIAEGERISKTTQYTHTVCHLFEKYESSFRTKRPSFLYLAEKQLHIAEDLVNYTLRKAWKSENFECVSRIIIPIIDFNLRNYEKGQKEFKFKPKIFNNSHFLESYLNCKYPPCDSSIQFFKTKDMKVFFDKYVQNKWGEYTEDNFEKDILLGVFIDVHDTLIKFEYQEDGKNGYIKVPETEKYALNKLKEGVNVTIFTDGNSEDYVKILSKLGVDERLLNVKRKHKFIRKRLETCIDDTSPILQGFMTQTHYKSGLDALNSEYPIIKT